MASTSNSSAERFFFPGEAERAALARSRRWQQRVQETVDLSRRFDAINGYCHSKGGFVVSLPNDPHVVLEVLPDSSLPRELSKLGYDVRPASPPEGQRIVANARTEEIITEGSTRPVFRTSHAGICKVLRYCFVI
jgi:hypothetical protein